MSVSTRITSLEASRNTIRNKLIELGMAQSGDKLEKLAIAIEGIINQGAVSVKVQEGQTYTIPRGYHNGSGTVSGVAGGGDYDLREPEPVTPTKSQQNIVPGDGYYGLKSVTVKAIPEAYQDVTSVTAGATDVLIGKIFVSADGTVTPGEMVNNGAVNKTLDVTTITYIIPKGYHSGSGKVQLVLETKPVTPTKSEQKVKPSSGKVLSEVVVAPIPDQYQDVSGVTAQVGHVLDGEYFVDKTGKLEEGTMPNKGAVIASIDGLTTTSYTVPAGYHNGNGTVSLTNDIEQALAAI